MRQFHQFGAESLGSKDPAADTEIIALSIAILRELGLNQLTLYLNSVGDPTCRVAYKKILQTFIRPNLENYCDDCQRRFNENPLRILDCKKEACSKLVVRNLAAKDFGASLRRVQCTFRGIQELTSCQGRNNFSS